MLRAVALELVTAFAFLSLVALHAEGERCSGWATQTVHRWLDPDRVPPWLGCLALLVVSARWVTWTRGWVVSWKVRARVLGGALAGLVVAAFACGWLVRTEQLPWWSDLRPDESLQLLCVEGVAFAPVALGLATAPAGVLVELARRPVHATLAGAALALGSFFCMGWGCRVDVGWGRAVLLGTGVGLGLALGGSRLVASPSLARADDSVGRRLVLVALVASVGSPGRMWLLGEQSVLDRLPVRGLVACLSHTWILQALLVCHLAAAWRRRRGLVVEVALCAGVALQLGALVLQVVPAKVLRVVPPGAFVVVEPAAAFALTTWGLIALGLLLLRRATCGAGGLGSRYGLSSTHATKRLPAA